MTPRAARTVGATIAVLALVYLVYHFAFSSPAVPRLLQLELEPHTEIEAAVPPVLSLSDTTQTVLLRLGLPQGVEIRGYRVEISRDGTRLWESGSTMPEGAREIRIEVPAARFRAGHHVVVLVRERKGRKDMAVASYGFAVKRPMPE